ncbi:thioester-containing protein 1 allele R1 isoform X2 [Xylocopa sonorina]|uniref:thioester-containing protein 1 allele R1 isoform X2 n=1 Tax=Xylocopa sonorina TaxID=1818115 RepID=UPI00403AF4AF
MDWRHLHILFLSCMILSVAAESFYSVVAPRIIRPDSEYHVTLSTTGVSTPSEIYVELKGLLDNGETFNTSQTVHVQPYTTRILRFEIGDIIPGKYQLIARGLSGIEFSDSKSIEYVLKSYSVFIQTDRAIYKPGNKVMFRCILLNSRLRPTLERLVDIHITDGKGNRVKQWTRPPVTHGIFNGEVELSEFPVLGTWRITANVGDQTFEKEFEVAEYVLPNFEVTIDAPKHFTFKDTKITATIYAKYTYGKPVKGEATVTAYPDIFSGVIQPIFQQPIRKTLPIDGKAIVDFDIRDELRLIDEYERPVMIDVAVEESLTGRRQNTSMQITLHKHKYTMDLIKTSEYYKPGLKYTAFIKLTYHDGTPVQDNKNPVTIKYSYTTDDQPVYTNITGMLDEHGMVKLDFYPPKSNGNTSYSLNIEANYLNLYEWFPSTNQAMSQNNEYIQAILKTENPTVDREVEIEVNSTSPLKYINYEIFGRGDILDAGSIYAQNKHTASFKFLPTYVMAPTAHVIVYYVGTDGEIIADSLDIELEGVLKNFVDIKIAPEEVGPGENVNLVITSNPNSYVGLLGVDQRSILLKSGNDISYEQVYKELKSYDNVHKSPYADSVFDRFLWSPGSATASDVFKETGAVIMTNGYVHENFRILYYRSGVAFAIPSAAESFSPIALSPEKTKIRKNFPETWLWQTLDAGYEGKNELKRTVPDSITSWVLTAFSVNDVHGLGLINEPRKLKVFRPFFIAMDLPYSVIRGEIVAIQIVVFNYMNKKVVAEVILTNEGQFDFAEMSNEVHDVPKLELYRTKKIDVKANSGASVTFMIIPRELGYITIKATANSILAGDAVERKLLVKAEGETQYINKAIFMDLRSRTSASTNITIDIPKNAVPDSEHIEISAVGDILGPSILNLANLIKMPSGCGEQNMLKFVPNIMVLNYLKNTNQLTQAVQGKALRYMEIGYQTELTYRHDDGSFSAFGMSDSNGSTWLTAFVAKAFKQASAYIPIEDRIINEALQWLANNQAPNGSFPEVGRVSHRDMQGGAAKGIALTAFTLIAFLENADSSGKYRNTINKGIDYIVRNMNDVDDVYALSICTYALNLAKHPYESTAFNLLESKAITKEDIKWWSKPVAVDDKNPWYHSLPRSVDVEMTSYALLTYLKRNLVVDSIPVMKWLVRQRNAEGGFASTQDTVIGIQALANLGEKLATKSNAISIVFMYEGGGQSQMNINPDNSIILQKQVLPRKTRLVNITATGNGFALVQVSFQYNLNVTGAWPLFTLDPQVDKNSNANHLQLSVCSGFVPTKEANTSNMVVMEVSLPSGFTVDRESLPSLEVSQNVKRVETKNGDTVVVLYFDEMNRQEYCPTVSAFRTHKVAKQRPVPVTIYDYYDSSRRARVFYEPRKATLCDICEDEDCENLCVSQPGKQKDSSNSIASYLSICTYLQPLLTLFSIALTFI